MMTDQFTYSMLDVVVGKILQDVGFDKCNSTALQVTTDVLHNYIKKLLLRIGSYTEVACRTQPTLKDVLLAFKDFNISIDDLQKYVKDYGQGPKPMEVPQYPIPRENHLNFLRPGSEELLIRPLHIHEHLPPMYTESETEAIILKKFNQVPIESDKTEKKDDSSKTDDKSESSTSDESVAEPMQELKSVLMTSSGFISSSSLGVLPESTLPKKRARKRSYSSKSTNAQKGSKVTSKKTSKKRNPNPDEHVFKKPRKRVPKSTAAKSKADVLDKNKQICLEKIMKKFVK